MSSGTENSDWIEWERRERWDALKGSEETASLINTGIGMTGLVIGSSPWYFEPAIRQMVCVINCWVSRGVQGAAGFLCSVLRRFVLAASAQ